MNAEVNVEGQRRRINAGDFFSRLLAKPKNEKVRHELADLLDLLDHPWAGAVRSTELVTRPTTFLREEAIQWLLPTNVVGSPLPPTAPSLAMMAPAGATYYPAGGMPTTAEAPPLATSTVAVAPTLLELVFITDKQGRVLFVS